MRMKKQGEHIRGSGGLRRGSSGLGAGRIGIDQRCVPSYMFPAGQGVFYTCMPKAIAGVRSGGGAVCRHTGACAEI